MLPVKCSNPECTAAYLVQPNLAGNAFRCPRCNALIQVPAADPNVSAPATTLPCSFKPFGYVLTCVGLLVGAWLGFRFAGAKGGLVGFFSGGAILFYIEILAFPWILNEAEIREKHGATIVQLVKSCSILFFVLAVPFVVWTPDSLRGAYLGYADPFTPFALGLGGLFALVRWKQRHPFSEVRTGEKLFGWPLAAAWILSVFAAFLWHSDPIAISVSRIQAGKYMAAIAALDQVINDNPENAMAYHNRGYANLCLGRLDAAIDDFTAVISLEPDDAAAYLLRGIAKRNRGQEPKEDFDRFLTLKPNASETIDATEREIAARSPPVNSE